MRMVGRAARSFFASIGVLTCAAGIACEVSRRRSERQRRAHDDMVITALREPDDGRCGAWLGVDRETGSVRRCILPRYHGETLHVSATGGLTR